MKKRRTEMNYKLNKCPFCGGHAVLGKAGKVLIEFFGQCTICGATGKRFGYYVLDREISEKYSEALSDCELVHKEEDEAINQETINETVQKAVFAWNMRAKI